MFKRFKQNPTPFAPFWMRLMVLGFALYVSVVAIRGRQLAPEDAENTDPVPIANYPAVQKLVDVDRWQRVLYPGYNQSIDVETVRDGSGAYAACGQTVTVRVTPYWTDEQAPVEAMEPSEPVSFTIGRDEVFEAWDRGVRGMRKGEQRQIVAGARLFDPQNEEVDAEPYHFILELLDIAPTADWDGEMIQLKPPVGGLPVGCGQVANLELKWLDAQGEATIAFPKQQPVAARMGDGVAGHGVDRFVIGMGVHEVRRITLPAAFLPQDAVIPLQEGKKGVVEVTRLPYKPEEPFTNPIQEELPDDPDRRPPERDSTLPNDGRDRESGGT